MVTRINELKIFLGMQKHAHKGCEQCRYLIDQLLAESNDGCLREVGLIDYD